MGFWSAHGRVWSAAWVQILKYRFLTIICHTEQKPFSVTPFHFYFNQFFFPPSLISFFPSNCSSHKMSSFGIHAWWCMYSTMFKLCIVCSKEIMQSKSNLFKDKRERDGKLQKLVTELQVLLTSIWHSFFISIYVCVF